MNEVARVCEVKVQTKISMRISQPFPPSLVTVSSRRLRPLENLSVFESPPMGGCLATDSPSPAEPTKPNPPPTPSCPKSAAISIRSDEFDDPDVKILFLGASECGKSAIWQQLKYIYCLYFGDDERYSFKYVIPLNIISDIKILVNALKRSGRSVRAELSNAVALVSELFLCGDELLPEVAEKIYSLWTDPIMKVIYPEILRELRVRIIGQPLKIF
jgi:hypothetical protein